MPVFGKALVLGTEKRRTDLVVGKGAQVRLASADAAMRLLCSLGLYFQALTGFRPFGRPAFQIPILDARRYVDAFPQFGPTGASVPQGHHEPEIHVLVVKIEFDGPALRELLIVVVRVHRFLLALVLLSQQTVDYNVGILAAPVNRQSAWYVV